MEELLRLLNNIVPLSEPLQQYLAQIIKRKVFKKRSYLLQEGQICNSIYYLETGTVRCFYDHDSVEVSIWFMNEGNIIISVESFLTQSKSHQYIHALEECVTWTVSYNELQTVYAKFPEFNLHRAVLLEKYYIESEKRQRMLSLNTAAERYAYLIETQPELTLYLPAKYIASYLNIDEAYFSKIKARYAS